MITMSEDEYKEIICKLVEENRAIEAHYKALIIGIAIVIGIDALACMISKQVGIAIILGTGIAVLTYYFKSYNSKP